MEFKLGDLCTITSSKRIYRNEYAEKGIYFYRGKEIIEKSNGQPITDKLYISVEKYNEISKKYGVPEKGDILITGVGTIGISYLVDTDEKFYFKDGNLIWLKDFSEKLNNQFLYIYFKSNKFKKEVERIAIGSTQRAITIVELKKLKIKIPSLEIQNKIVKIYNSINKKIELNNKINDNLEKQLKILFNEMFFEKIKNNNTNEFEEKILYDVLEVIDNRGKTPKLVATSNYPILDVRALSGDGRIINYNMCEKYVDEEVYNTFFRSGHPKKNDILLSTVGSLAEMKLFIENKGTVAQNVVALRSKIDYPMFLYQYLKAIKSDLIAYNIGSVQPSIKVTQFMKHSFYLPKSDELKKFENLSVAYTNKMFNLNKEIEALTQLRDTLLPKLMNGEIDLDKIEI